jgi:hypothetical protein
MQVTASQKALDVEIVCFEMLFFDNYLGPYRYDEKRESN